MHLDECQVVFLMCNTFFLSSSGHLHPSVPPAAPPRPAAGHSLLAHAAHGHPGAQHGGGHALPEAGAPAGAERGRGQRALPAADLWVSETGLDRADQLVDPHGGRYKVDTPHHHHHQAEWKCGKTMERIKKDGESYKTKWTIRKIQMVKEVNESAIVVYFFSFDFCLLSHFEIPLYLYFNNVEKMQM